MKEFFIEFLNLLANCILVICLSLMSFLLISNFFHYKDVSYKYNANLNENLNYVEYKKILKSVEKKMNSVDYDNVSYSVTAKPIYEYYTACVNSLEKGTFSKFASKNSFSALDVYNANKEILQDYNSVCVFGIPNNISVIYDKITPNVSFDETKKLTDQKADIIINTADYLTESGLGNSSYSFYTDVTRSTIYDKVKNEFNLTVDNYKMIALLLDDVANWYVDEYGGNK